MHTGRNKVEAAREEKQRWGEEEESKKKGKIRRGGKKEKPMRSVEWDAVVVIR